jgi:hypothetical protein
MFIWAQVHGEESNSKSYRLKKKLFLSPSCMHPKPTPPFLPHVKNLNHICKKENDCEFRKVFVLLFTGFLPPRLVPGFQEVFCIYLLGEYSGSQ